MADEHSSEIVNSELEQELKDLKEQLSEIEVELQTQPDDEELLALKKELRDLIETAQSQLQSQSQDKAQAIPEISQFSIGELVKAKYSQDGKYYDARVDASKGDDQYLVTYTQYGNTEFVNKRDLKKLPTADDKTEDDKKRNNNNTDQKLPKKNANKPPTNHGVQSQQQQQPPVRKRKKATFEERMEKREKEAAEKQNAWLSFAAKAPARPSATGRSVSSTQKALARPVAQSSSHRPPPQAVNAVNQINLSFIH
ncbi:hypothetical protein MIR68_006421 [Amoeboaphelidium protococcarum]|nr:hypothetical protein MIR68_006421 [Amoeboaphelidium protococcarum]